MKPQRFELKEKIIKLRQKGYSITRIEKIYGIPRSTLSGWFKNLKIEKKYQDKLIRNSKIALKKARKKAVIWHNQQKLMRVSEAKSQALSVVNKINKQDKTFLELALAFLYLGEGAKKDVFSIANSNPQILNFFLSAIEILYNQKRGDLKYDLHLRFDQKELESKKYWAKALQIPIKNIKYCAFDKRTKGKKTHKDYKGVCLVYAKDIKHARRLLEIAHLYSNMDFKRA